MCYYTNAKKAYTKIDHLSIIQGYSRTEFVIGRMNKNTNKLMQEFSDLLDKTGTVEPDGSLIFWLKVASNYIKANSLFGYTF